MTWILDEFSSVGGQIPAVVTSKPIELGGLRGRRTTQGCVVPGGRLTREKSRWPARRSHARQDA